MFGPAVGCRAIGRQALAFDAARYLSPFFTGRGACLAQQPLQMLCILFSVASYSFTIGSNAFGSMPRPAPCIRALAMAAGRATGWPCNCWMEEVETFFSCSSNVL